MKMQEVLKAAIAKYGPDMQLTVVIEECAELIQQICKYKRGQYNKIRMAEEIADVEIMLEQLKMIWELEAEKRDVKCYSMDDVVSELNVVISYIIDFEEYVNDPFYWMKNEDVYDIEFKINWLKTSLCLHPLVEVEKQKKLARLKERIEY